MVTIEKFMFESTYPESLVSFFFKMHRMNHTRGETSWESNPKVEIGTLGSLSDLGETALGTLSTLGNCDRYRDHLWKLC